MSSNYVQICTGFSGWTLVSVWVVVLYQMVMNVVDFLIIKSTKVQ